MVNKSLKNNFVLTIILLNIFYFKPTTQTSANSTHYIAGVVEFQPTQFSQPEWSSSAKLQDNLQSYLQIIKSNEAKDTDILVFPEMTLNDNEESTFAPDPKEYLQAPCDKITNQRNEKYHDFLIQLSCAAKSLRKYIVINIVEKDHCLPPQADPRPCASNGLNLFNTNVVFDRNGVVVSRYRKVHLYGEPRNITFEPTFGYFDTDFGVRFGHFVCFDLLFYMPAQEMVDKMGITDFIFPTMWFSQLPFLTAVQMQSAWSYANDVNFLAAGASYPPVGTTGTGIFAGRRGSLEAIMSRTEGQRKLIVASVKKHAPKRARRDLVYKNIIEKAKQQRVNDDIFLKRDYLENYDTVQVDLSDNGHSCKTQLCQRNLNTSTKFCCHFELNWTQLQENTLQKPHYTYRLGAFNGLRKEVAPETNVLRNCALFACTGPTIDECGKVFANTDASNVTFNHLVIEAKFPKADELLIMPNSLKDNLLPVGVENFNWTETIQGSYRHIRFELIKPVSNLLTFSIYANYYDSFNATDEPISCSDNEIDAASKFCDDERGDDGATVNFVSMILFILCVISGNSLL